MRVSSHSEIYPLTFKDKTILSKQEIDKVLAETRLPGTGADEMSQTVLEQLGAKLERETTKIHTVGVYDDESAVAGLSAAQMCNLIGERLDQREPQIRARAEIIVIKLRASTDYSQQDRRPDLAHVSVLSRHLSL